MFAICFDLGTAGMLILIGVACAALCQRQTQEINVTQRQMRMQITSGPGLIDVELKMAPLLVRAALWQCRRLLPGMLATFRDWCFFLLVTTLVILWLIHVAVQLVQVCDAAPFN